MQLSLGALTPREEVNKRYGKRISAAAARFVRDLTLPFRPSFYSLIAFTVQQALWKRDRVDHASFDYRFWQENGWLDYGRWYYDAAQKRTPRVLLARLLGKLTALFFH